MHLTKNQQNQLLSALALLVSGWRGTGLLVNPVSGAERSIYDYCNEVLTYLGFDVEMQPPPKRRELASLRVVTPEGEELPGRVSKSLEQATRRKPDAPVWAKKSAGWWLSDWGGGEGQTWVRVIAREQ